MIYTYFSPSYSSSALLIYTFHTQLQKVPKYLTVCAFSMVVPLLWKSFSYIHLILIYLAHITKVSYLAHFLKIQL